MSRRNQPPGDSLWDDFPFESSGSESSGSQPPDWALPSWDALPAEEADRKPDRSDRTAERPRLGRQPAPARLVESPRPVEPAPALEPAASNLRILQVSDVTRAIRDAVRAEPILRDVWVEGEVGRVTVSAAGHAYFTLKDERSQLACVFFRDDRVGSPFEPRTGLRFVVHGRVDIFETQGVYQLYVMTIQPAGFGDLALRFEALKARLSAEGLFATPRKRPLPDRPAVIGVVTSSSGAVWHDIRHVISHRWPLARLVLSPCQVQGDGAAASVVAALERLARWRQKCISAGHPQDAPAVVILARGGGSLEDLWSFNDERVVRAVVAHPVPIVCGVGHEVDVTLADFAADVRAPTPSAAAELVVPDRLDFAVGLQNLINRASSCAVGAAGAARREVAAESRALERLRPRAQLTAARERAGYLLDRARRAVRLEIGRGAELEHRLATRLAPVLDAQLAGRRVALERCSAALGALGPQATLDRGYAIVRRRQTGEIVRDREQAPAGDRLAIRVARGEIGATVDGETPGRERNQP